MKSIFIIAIPAVLILVLMMNWTRFIPASGGFLIMNSSKAMAQETKTIPVSAAPTIIVECDAGNVEIVSGEGDVRIDAQKHAPTEAEAQKMTYTVDDRDNTIHIVYRDPDRSQRDRHIDFKIQAPRDSVLKAITGGGNIDVFGFSQGITGRTGGGNVRATNVAGVVRLDTGGGNIEGGGLNGVVDLTTGGGNIEAQGELRGAVSLRTGGGNINAESVAGEVKAQTGAGNISIGGRFTGTSDISSGSGNVRAVIPPDSALSISAATSMGHISDDFGLNASSAQMGGSAFLNGQIGNGGNSLKINTGNGNVSIEKG